MSSPTNYKIDPDAAIAVATDYFWRPISEAPMGVKLQLLSIGGVALHGQLSSGNLAHYLGWTPLPKRRKE